MLQAVILEPSCETALAVEGFSPGTVTQSVLWTLMSDSSGAFESKEAQSLVYSSSFASRVGWYRVSAEVWWWPLDADAIVATTTVRTQIFEARYVRISIRPMSVEVRGAFFDAFAMLEQLSQKECARCYGSEYKPFVYFVTLHLNLAGRKRAGHLHGGMGFLTQHVSLSNEFETALRVVNPSVSLPFWDSTQDSHVVKDTTRLVKALWTLNVWRPE